MAKGQVVPPTSITGATAGATGFTSSGDVGIVVLAMLACTAGVTVWVTGGASANGAGTGGGGKEYRGGGTPIGIGVIKGGGAKFNCGGYWIGFRHQPLAHLLLSMNVMGGDEG